jgi:hypothetical protein
MNWIFISATVSSLALGLYLAIRDKEDVTVRRVSWCIMALVVLMTAIGLWLNMKAPRLHLGLLGPHLSAAEGYDYVKRHAEDQDQLQLLEAIGSYYTCIRKPDVIFLQFCEWVFVFRSPDSTHLVEYRVLDNRMPELPILPQATLLEGIRDGGFATYVSYNTPPQALGMRGMDDDDSAVHQYDAKGRVIVKSMGKGPRYSFAEINEGPNEFVISLTRACARPTDHLAESTVIERWNRFGDVVIYRTTHPRNSFYDRLTPMEFGLDAQEAITHAMEAGAEFEVPGKRMVSAGAVRLHDGQDIDVPGPCWRLPMRMSLRPIVVHATSRRVYFVDDDGKYTAYWSTKQYLQKLFVGMVGMLFLILLAMAIYAVKRSR